MLPFFFKNLLAILAPDSASLELLAPDFAPLVRIRKNLCIYIERIVRHPNTREK